MYEKKKVKKKNIYSYVKILEILNLYVILPSYFNYQIELQI